MIAGTDVVVPPKPKGESDWQALKEKGGLVKFATEVERQVDTGLIFPTNVSKKALKLLEDNVISMSWNRTLIQKALVASGMTEASN